MSSESGGSFTVFIRPGCYYISLSLMVTSKCIGQIEASTSPPPGAFDTFAVPGRREFDYQNLPGGGEFDPHGLGVGNLNCTLDFM